MMGYLTGSFYIELQCLYERYLNAQNKTLEESFAQDFGLLSKEGEENGVHPLNMSMELSLVVCMHYWYWSLQTFLTCTKCTTVIVPAGNLNWISENYRCGHVSKCLTWRSVGKALTHHVFLDIINKSKNLSKSDDSHNLNCFISVCNIFWELWASWKSFLVSSEGGSLALLK